MSWYWSNKTCKAPVNLSSAPTNQHPAFYRTDALPASQPTVSVRASYGWYIYGVYHINMLVASICDPPVAVNLIVPRVRRSTFGARAFAIAGPTVWNSLPDSLRDPTVGPDQFRCDLKTHLFEWHCVSFSALAVFSRNALYKSTFYLLIYLLTNSMHF